MEHERSKLKEAFTMTSYMLLVVVSLPLLAVAAFAARFVVLGILLLAVPVGLVLYAVNPRVRAWFGDVETEDVRFSGLRLASDVALHRGHGWARMADERVTVGADDLVQSVLGPIEEVTLPQRGRTVRQGEPLFTLRRQGRTVTMRAPVSGTVLQTNDALIHTPTLVNSAPFDAGWVVRMSGPPRRLENRGLLRGGHAKVWFRGEIDRLFENLQPASAAPALADGGVLVHELYRQIDDATWSRLHAAMFD